MGHGNGVYKARANNNKNYFLSGFSTSVTKTSIQFMAAKIWNNISDEWKNYSYKILDEWKSYSYKIFINTYKNHLISKLIGYIYH